MAPPPPPSQIRTSLAIDSVEEDNNSSSASQPLTSNGRANGGHHQALNMDGLEHGTLATHLAEEVKEAGLNSSKQGMPPRSVIIRPFAATPAVMVVFRDDQTTDHTAVLNQDNMAVREFYQWNKEVVLPEVYRREGHHIIFLHGDHHPAANGIESALLGALIGEKVATNDRLSKRFQMANVLLEAFGYTGAERQYALITTARMSEQGANLFGISLESPLLCPWGHVGRTWRSSASSSSNKNRPWFNIFAYSLASCTERQRRSIGLDSGSINLVTGPLAATGAELNRQMEKVTEAINTLSDSGDGAAGIDAAATLFRLLAFLVTMDRLEFKDDFNGLAKIRDPEVLASMAQCLGGSEDMVGPMKRALTTRLTTVGREKLRVGLDQWAAEQQRELVASSLYTEIWRCVVFLCSKALSGTGRADEAISLTIANFIGIMERGNLNAGSSSKTEVLSYKDFCLNYADERMNCWTSTQIASYLRNVRADDATVAMAKKSAKRAARYLDALDNPEYGVVTILNASTEHNQRSGFLNAYTTDFDCLDLVESNTSHSPHVPGVNKDKLRFSVNHFARYKQNDDKGTNYSAAGFAASNSCFMADGMLAIILGSGIPATFLDLENRLSQQKASSSTPYSNNNFGRTIGRTLRRTQSHRNVRSVNFMDKRKATILGDFNSVLSNMVRDRPFIWHCYVLKYSKNLPRKISKLGLGPLGHATAAKCERLAAPLPGGADYNAQFMADGYTIQSGFGAGGKKTLRGDVGSGVVSYRDFDRIRKEKLEAQQEALRRTPAVQKEQRGGGIDQNDIVRELEVMAAQDSDRASRDKRDDFEDIYQARDDIKATRRTRGKRDVLPVTHQRIEAALRAKMARGENITVKKSKEKSPYGKLSGLTRARVIWVGLAYLVSLGPLFTVLSKPWKSLRSKASRIAWREKFLIAFIMLVLSGAFITLLVIFDLFLCGTGDPLDGEFLCTANQFVLIIGAGVILLVVFIRWMFALRLPKVLHSETFRHEGYVVMLVTCYTEGPKELNKTLKSLAVTEYPDQQKLMFIVCDGMIRGADEDRLTPDIVLDILGGPSVEELPEHTFSYQSVAEVPEKMYNTARIWSGYYCVEGHKVPAVVIIKSGVRGETVKPGNRGKRDSQVLLYRWLNRVCTEQPMAPMELELTRQIAKRFSIDSRAYEYLMAVDADTYVYPDSLPILIHAFNKEAKLLGACGETKVAREKGDSFVTKSQVFEYFISHNMNKMFESRFGSVTCLPGCFSVYRIRERTPEEGESFPAPLLVSGDIIRQYAVGEVETLHEKNLLKLGEDRFLSTILLARYYNAGYKMRYVPQAVCRTVVPEDFTTLTSQRRRWINSTIHNLWELVFSNTQLCGCGPIGMKFVILLDLMSTFLLPAGIAFLIYLIVEAFVSGDVPIVALVGFVVLILLQVIICLILGRPHQVKMMIWFLLNIPYYYVYLPIYSVWHMDDFGWGATRVVFQGTEGGADGVDNNQVNVPFQVGHYPLMRWSEFARDAGIKTDHLEGYDPDGTLQRPGASLRKMQPKALRDFGNNYSQDGRATGVVSDENLASSPDPQAILDRSRKKRVSRQESDYVHDKKGQAKPGLDSYMRE
eukprot:Clim_evm78s156 gene=Clim_evmTU78s156